MLFDITVTKANRTVVFDIESLPVVKMDGQVIPPEAVTYMFEYGARQCLIDTTAGVKRESFDSDEKFHAAAWEKAGKRYDQLASGRVPTARTPADPRMATARRNAQKLIDAGEVDVDEFLAWRAARQASTVAPDSTLIPTTPSPEVAAFVETAKKHRKHA